MLIFVCGEHRVDQKTHKTLVAFTDDQSLIEHAYIFNFSIK